jgi:hypothetical protein
MRALLWARRVTADMRDTAPFRRPLRTAGTAGCLMLAGAFGLLTSPYGGPDPADPGARVPAVRYRSTVGPYERLRPVEPAPWREQNERVAPRPKQ